MLLLLKAGLGKWQAQQKPAKHKKQVNADEPHTKRRMQQVPQHREYQVKPDARVQGGIMEHEYT